MWRRVWGMTGALQHISMEYVALKNRLQQRIGDIPIPQGFWIIDNNEIWLSIVCHLQMMQLKQKNLYNIDSFVGLLSILNNSLP